MKVGIIGSGGREHSLCEALNKSKKITKIYCFPGNAGTQQIAENININIDDFEILKKFVISSNCPTGPSEILDNGKGGLLFKVGDYKDLAKKIIFFQKNKKLCLNMKINAYKRLKRFNYHDNLNRYFTIIKKYL